MSLSPEDRLTKKWLLWGMLGSLTIGGLITMSGYVIGGGLAIEGSPDQFPKTPALLMMVGGILLALVGGVFSFYKAYRSTEEGS